MSTLGGAVHHETEGFRGCIAGAAAKSNPNARRRYLPQRDRSAHRMQRQFGDALA